MRFINKDGVSRYGRYRILPEAGNDHLEAAAAAAKGPNYLFDEIEHRIANEPVKFRVVAQLAEDGDTVNDVTIRWPESRKLVELGKLVSSPSRCSMKFMNRSRLSSTPSRAWTALMLLMIRCWSSGQRCIC